MTNVTTSSTDRGRNGRRGTVRFEPYYKLEWFDARAMAWRPIQRSHPTKADADSEARALCFSKYTQVRVYEVTAPGRAGRRVAATWMPAPR